MCFHKSGSLCIAEPRRPGPSTVPACLCILPLQLLSAACAELPDGSPSSKRLRVDWAAEPSAFASVSAQRPAVSSNPGPVLVCLAEALKDRTAGSAAAAAAATVAEHLAKQAEDPTAPAPAPGTPPDPLAAAGRAAAVTHPPPPPSSLQVHLCCHCSCRSQALLVRCSRLACPAWI